MTNSDAHHIADICVRALKSGNKIMFCGNGGSAADAQHLAAELVGKLNFDRPPLAAIALTTDTSILTAIANDYGYEHVFSRQIEALGKPDDVLIGMSTSGKSKNILEAIYTANAHSIITIGLTGENNEMMKYNCSICISIPSNNTQSIQEEHMKLGHKFCGLIEERMFK